MEAHIKAGVVTDRAGHETYSRRMLSGYDVWVLGISNSLIWRCPTKKLLAHYDTHISNNHLDVGVGTGYFLDKCKAISPAGRLAMMDANDSSLAYAADRVARYRPELHRHDVRLPITEPLNRVDSVGINYLLHCLDGGRDVKSAVLDNLARVMNPGAVIFGSTLLQGPGVKRGFLAQRLMKFYNERGIFSNERDDRQTLERMLSERFSRVSVEMVGCAALFSGYA